MAWVGMLAASLPWLTCCAGGPTRAEHTHPDGRRAAQGDLVDGLQEGTWTFWHDNGAVEARGDYHRDERTGTWTHWYPDGTLRMRGTYRGERQQGLWEFWHPNGRLQCRGEYHDGREHGEWTFWAVDGTELQRGCFDAGKRCLQWSEFTPATGTTARGKYLADVPVGTWTKVAADGTRTTLCYPLPDAIQVVHETWDDGSTRREGFVRDGVPFGMWVTRHRGGALRAMVTFAAGTPGGELLTCDADGQVLARGPVQDGRADGTWLLRSAAGLQPQTVLPAPRAPWDRQWSEATVVAAEPPLTVAGRWLDELLAPREVLPQPTDPTAVPEAARNEAPLAPTDPGAWTARERAELTIYRRYYRDGWLPRKHQAGRLYGGAADSRRLGTGDATLSGTLVGKPLPHTSFPTADGKLLDLAVFRGKRVLLVVLRGFTTQVCVYCFAQTAELAPLAEQWRQLDCEVVVMFPGNKSRMQAFAAACAREFGDTTAPYHLVYDPDLELAKALGLVGNLARPASFVLDQNGIVRHAYVAESIENTADRPAASELLRWVEATR